MTVISTNEGKKHVAHNTAQEPNLSTEAARVFAMLRNLHLLNVFTQTGTIAGAILSHNTDFLCSLGLQQTHLRHRNKQT